MFTCMSQIFFVPDVDFARQRSEQRLKVILRDWVQDEREYTMAVNQGHHFETSTQFVLRNVYQLHKIR